MIEPEISLEFIQENQKLDRTRQFSKKGGPYNKKEREKRQNEVHRLHFEYGYSALKISEMMKINRHTITSDINYWYSKLSNKAFHLDPTALCMKQLNRIEIQRTRLIEEIEKQQNFQDKLSLEKLIFEMDSKIAYIGIKITTSKDTVAQFSADLLNSWMKKNNLPVRYYDQDRLTCVSERTYKKICNLVKNDPNNPTVI